MKVASYPSVYSLGWIHANRAYSNKVTVSVGLQGQWLQMVLKTLNWTVSVPSRTCNKFIIQV